MTEVESKLKRVMEIVENRLLAISETLDPEDYQDAGIWEIGHSYMFLYDLLRNGTNITQTQEDYGAMVEMCMNVSGPAAMTYRKFQSREDALSEEEQGLYALLFSFLYLYKEFVNTNDFKKKLN
jgi:hypothetical protein